MGPVSAAVPSGWRVRVVTRAESMKYSLGDLTSMSSNCWEPVSSQRPRGSTPGGGGASMRILR